MKKRNQGGFTHHLVLIAVAVLVVGAVGFAAWRVRKNNIDAQASNYCVKRSIKKGSSGTCVVAMQGMLKSALGSDLAVDGNFGSQTDSAVRDFQRRKGLIVDGKVGPAQTWPALCAVKNPDTSYKFSALLANCSSI